MLSKCVREDCEAVIGGDWYSTAGFFDLRFHTLCDLIFKPLCVRSVEPWLESKNRDRLNLFLHEVGKYELVPRVYAQRMILGDELVRYTAELQATRAYCLDWLRLQSSFNKFDL